MSKFMNFTIWLPFASVMFSNALLQCATASLSAVTRSAFEVFVFSMSFAGFASPVANEQNAYEASATWPTSWPKLRTSGVGLREEFSSGFSCAAPPTALLTNEYKPFSLAVIGLAGGADCACDLSCANRATGTAINAANTKQRLFLIVIRNSLRNTSQSTIRMKRQIVTRYLRSFCTE